MAGIVLPGHLFANRDIGRTAPLARNFPILAGKFEFEGSLQNAFMAYRRFRRRGPIRRFVRRTIRRLSRPFRRIYRRLRF